MIYRQGDSLPGPGDPETWGPYRGGNDPRGPSLTAREERDISRRAEELAIESFDSLDDDARQWLAAEIQESADDCVSIISAALFYELHPNDSYRVTDAVERLRERYVKEHRDHYREQAKQECEATENEDYGTGREG